MQIWIAFQLCVWIWHVRLSPSWCCFCLHIWAKGSRTLSWLGALMIWVDICVKGLYIWWRVDAASPPPLPFWGNLSSKPNFVRYYILFEFNFLFFDQYMQQLAKLMTISWFHCGGPQKQGFNSTLTESVDTPGRRGGDQIKEMELKLHPELKESLLAICNDPKTTVVVLSGSDRNVLDDVLPYN